VEVVSTRTYRRSERKRFHSSFPARDGAGFTAIELMNFLGLAAVLSAIAMYALGRYVRHAKTVEAASSVTSLANVAAEYYNTSDATQPTGAAPHAVHAMRHFPPSSRVSVPEDPLSVRGRRYQSNIADWGASPWRELRFSIVQPQCYQYSFEASGAGGTAKAVVTAEGDLDGDGVRSLFSLEVVPDEGFTAQVAKTMTKRDVEE
jgi:type II secretory pathway pseudopilin PulG